MTTEWFTVSHAKDATFTRGLRSFFEYRDLGIKATTTGQVVVHVIRSAASKAFSSQPHCHEIQFQLVYVLKGWIEFEYEGQGGRQTRSQLLCSPATRNTSSEDWTQ